jgi:hypothetical protein
MKHFGNYFWPAIFAALIFSFAGCSSLNRNRSAGSNPAFALPTELSAALTNGSNVVLHWKNNATADGGVWVEYTTPGSDYIQLDALDSDSGETSFVHPNVAPQTTLLYRLEPFFGRPTGSVGITTGPASTNDVPHLPMGPIDPTNAVALDQWPKFSIRTMTTFARAMPSDLTTALSSPSSVDVRWKDHASDEDGFLLEISADPAAGFVPCALLPPDTTSFRKTGLPPTTKCYFRVRAFFYGRPTDPTTMSTSAR